MDARIRYLSKRLDRLEVVDRAPREPHRVYFGAWVGLEDEQGNERRFRIVGADEIDAARAWISIDSPLGRALLGKAVDDEVSIDAPAGTQTWWVVDIAYDPAAQASTDH